MTSTMFKTISRTNPGALGRTLRAITTEGAALLAVTKAISEKTASNEDYERGAKAISRLAEFMRDWEAAAGEKSDTDKVSKTADAVERFFQKYLPETEEALGTPAAHKKLFG